ncbi:MAG TPA: UvrD-helicase domain-containing protein [Streptosporangiaceae bacterium]
MFQADTHIHSRFSRACSKDCDVANLAWWALRKGITVVGTGDFTHPAWAEELAASLIPAEPGLFRLRPDLQTQLHRKTPASCDRPVRFMLSVEISTIYRRADRTRKVHHLLYAPTFEAAGRITTALSKIGNLASDGRPILGLDSRDLLEITLNGGTGCYLVPAHVWTPWFAALGSRSGFDSVAECYADLADQVFAVETGLSSDPPMNWMCSVLDSYRLVSNSDAHSPPMLGREATTFSTGLDYFEMADALRTGHGLAGTIEFYPEEGKYHLDGHRKCGVRLTPEETRSFSGICPKCDKPLTVGVLHRVAALADRAPGYRPDGAPASTNLIRLPQIIGELLSVGPQSKKVTAETDRLVATLGPEIEILTEVAHEEIARAGGSLLAEAVARLRRGEVIREAGFDGEYGTVRLMRPEELAPAGALFDVPAVPAADKAGPCAPTADPQPSAVDVTSPASGGQQCHIDPHDPPGSAADGAAAGAAEGALAGLDAEHGLLAGLDEEQRAAVTAAGPVLIVAGPGTGKTRTLTHRIARQIAGGWVRPGQCLAITFTRRAAEEMRIRLAALIGPRGRRLTVTTFHGLGLQILRENHALAGLDPAFGVADEAAALAAATELAGSATAGQRMLAQAAGDADARAEFRAALRARGLVDFDSLVELPVALLEREPELRSALCGRWPSISVDEYQDINEPQYTLLRLLTAGPVTGPPAAPAAGSGLTVIGDPDQAIYRFRGCDVGFFLRFGEDFPGARTVRLTTNYRSAPDIVAAAVQAVAPVTLVPGRELRAAPRPAQGQAAGRRPQPAGVVRHEAADERAEAEWIAAEIDRLLGGASFHSLDSDRSDGQGHGGLGLADVAVLYRTDSQAKALTQALTRAGLPFQKRSHDRLAQRAGVAEIVREMRLTTADTPDATATDTSDPDTAARDTGGKEVASAGADAGGPDGGPTTGSTVTSRLRAAVRRLAQGAAQPVAADIRAAGEVLRPLAGRCGRDLARFLTEIAVGAEADALDPRADAVTLLTLHAAKGLEFDVVFLAGCERGLLPLWIPGTERDEAEERRLLFVGMTRARARLLLSSAATRNRYGADRPGGPSPFLAAIDPALLARTGAAAPRARRPQQLRLL